MTKLPSGTYLELYEPTWSGHGAARKGQCPGCPRNLEGYVGRIAVLNELDSEFNHVSQNNYGHYECVEKLYHTFLESVRTPTVVPDAAPTTITESPYVWGHQKDMLALGDKYAEQSEYTVEWKRDRTRARGQQYGYRLRKVEM